MPKLIAMRMRWESDSLGRVRAPAGALYGAGTQRALAHSGSGDRQMPRRFVHAVGLLKWACAEANVALGVLPRNKGNLIARAAREVASGRLDAHFPLGILQTGSATSTNMNANEVIANRARQLAGSGKRRRPEIHPNDDVNKGQSSNDLMPTALHVSVVLALRESLIPALDRLARELAARSDDFRDIVKTGRTHLMDAVPMTLGQEFSGYAAQARKGAQRARRASECLLELAVGGTAVGTGLNAPRGFAGRVITLLRRETGCAFRRAGNPFEAQAARDDCVEAAGQIVAISAALLKIAGDIRLLGSGPRTGIGELKLPALQPGSSIMPGKVNPVLCEVLIQACHYANGLCQTVARCGGDGQLELNATLPIMAHCLHEAIDVLDSAIRAFTRGCVMGLKADASRCRELVERSLMQVTVLAPVLGYDLAAAIAREALATGKSLREVVLRRGLMSRSALDRALNPARMTRGGAARAGKSRAS